MPMRDPAGNTDCCWSPKPGLLRKRAMTSPEKHKHSYLFDLLVRAGDPQQPIAKKYSVDKFQKV